MNNNLTYIKKIFISLFVLIICFKASCENIKIINDQPGTGTEIVNHSKIKVHYIGKLEDGTEFDSSYKRGKPFIFQIGNNQVILGWEKGLMGMKVGGKRTLIIPPELAYGEKGASDLIPSNSTLTFEIEIIDVLSPGYKLINVADVEKKIKKGFIVIDIRTEEERNKTDIIPGSVLLTAFDEYGNFETGFFKSYQKIVTNSDNVIFVSDKGDISSVLANGFVEKLGAINMYSLEGGIQAYLKLKNY